MRTHRTQTRAMFVGLPSMPPFWSTLDASPPWSSWSRSSCFCSLQTEGRALSARAKQGSLCIPPPRQTMLQRLGRPTHTSPALTCSAESRWSSRCKRRPAMEEGVALYRGGRSCVKKKEENAPLTDPRTVCMDILSPARMPL